MQNGIYTTRVASTDDAKTLVEVGITTFKDTFAASNTAANMKAYLEKTFTIDQLIKDLADPRCIFILLYDRQRVAGYAKMKKGKSDTGELRKIEIERVYAMKEYIGKKAGKTLMQTCLDFARSENYEIVWLGVWEHNARAIAFYEQWGFKTVGASPFWFGDDQQTDLVMEKKLDKDENASV